MPDGKGLLARFPSNPLVQGLRLLPLGGRAEDLLSIKPAVLDEDLRDLRARRHTPRDVYAGDRRFQGFGIDLRASRIGIEGDSDALEQRQFGMKPDQRVDPGCGNPLLVAERTAHEHIARRDLADLTAEPGLDIACLDAGFEVGAEPVLHTLGPRGAAIDDRRARPRAKQLQRGFDRGVFAADHDNVETVGEVRFVEVVVDVRQVFTRDAELVDVVEVAGREDQLVPRDRLAPETRFDFSRTDEFGVGLHADPLDPGDAAIVFQRLFAGRLLTGRHEWVIADLEALRRRKERHLDRVPHDRIRERARVDDEGIDATALGGNGARQADRPGARDTGRFVLQWWQW